MGMGSVLVALLLVLQGGGRPPLADVPDWATATPPASAIASLRPVGPSQEGGPACIGDVCQGAVSLPGSNPSYDGAGKRTELALALLHRMDLGAVSSIARTVAVSGVRVDYRPPQIDILGGGQGGGYGKVKVVLRWRLDAFLTPDWSDPLPR
jgi:hypothetical protein